MAFEAKFKHGVHPYFDQYLETATKGNVTATYAVYIDRMQLHCKACDETLTVKEPAGTTVDYGVQEFVKIHSHVGGHKAEPKCNCSVFVDAQSWRHETHCPRYAPPPKPVTVDFKPLKHVKIDEFSVNEEKIKSQLSAYNNEVAEKLADAAIAKKIAELQKEAEQGSAGKYQIYTAPEPGFGPKVWKSEWSNSWTNEWDQYPKEKEQAFKNIADLQNMAKLKILLIQEKVKEPEPPKAEKEKPKPLKIATGRKFR